MRYRMQNRYQDSSWENIDREFSSEQEAVKEAERCARDAFAYGMTRILDMHEKRVVITFAAGGGGVVTS